MVDEIRRGDWAPRSVHRNTRRVDQVHADLEHRLGREPNPKEMADALGVDQATYRQMVQDSLYTRLCSFEEHGTEQHGPDMVESSVEPFERPHQTHQREAFQRQLAAAIADLNEREQLVLSLYYDEELNLKEIGLILEVSESRVSQIHSQIASKLRRKLSGWS
jgi:RNA polymerase sigma factor for flagellar operon FliA